ERLFHPEDHLIALRDRFSATAADPATDLAWLISSLEPELFDEVYGAYQEELPTSTHPRLLERAQALGEFVVAEWLLHGLDTGDETIASDARGMLTDLDADLAQLAREEAERTYEEMNSRDDGTV